MGNRMIIIAAEPNDFTVTLDQFRAARNFWGPHSALVGGASDDDPVDAAIQVDRPGEPFFQIFHFSSNAMLSTDGTEAQAAEVAVWAVNTFPTTGPGELWMTDQGYSGHTVLSPGISPADIWTGWQEHS